MHPDPSAVGFNNAWSIVGLEQSLQSWLMAEATIVVYFFNWVYTIGFWPIMAATGLYFFVTDRDTYLKYRTLMLVSYARRWPSSPCSS